MCKSYTLGKFCKADGTALVIGKGCFVNGVFVTKYFELDGSEYTGAILFPTCTPKWLEFVFNDLLSTPGNIDVTNLDAWNGLLGASFTSISVTGNNFITLYGGSNVELANLSESSSLLEVHDNGCVTSVAPTCFKGSTALQKIRLGSLVGNNALGGSAGEDWVFDNIVGNVIDIEIPLGLMTCNAGAPDDDIAYLVANNSVTIITV